MHNVIFYISSLDLGRCSLFTYSSVVLLALSLHCYYSIFVVFTLTKLHLSCSYLQYTLLNPISSQVSSKSDLIKSNSCLFAVENVNFLQKLRAVLCRPPLGEISSQLPFILPSPDNTVPSTCFCPRRSGE